MENKKATALMLKIPYDEKLEEEIKEAAVDLWEETQH